jgi:hypothetical protein
MFKERTEGGKKAYARSNLGHFSRVQSAHIKIQERQR